MTAKMVYAMKVCAGGISTTRQMAHVAVKMAKASVLVNGAIAATRMASVEQGQISAMPNGVIAGTVKDRRR